MSYRLSGLGDQDPHSPHELAEYLKDIRVQFGLIFIAFGFLGLLTSLAYESTSRLVYQTEVVPAKQLAGVVAVDGGGVYDSGGLVGPFNITEKMILRLQISSRDFRGYGRNPWSYIEVDVLDQDKKFVFSFSDEIYYEDSESSKYKFSLDSVFENTGRYYLKVKNPEGNADLKLFLSLYRLHGNTTYFHIYGIILIILGGLCLVRFYHKEVNSLPLDW